MAEKRVYNTKQRDEILRCLGSFGNEHFTAAAKKLGATCENTPIKAPGRGLFLSCIVGESPL